MKAAREKRQIKYRGTKLKMIANFSSETIAARRQWNDIFRVLHEKSCPPRILYETKIFFKIEGEIKTFLDKK